MDALKTIGFWLGLGLAGGAVAGLVGVGVNHLLDEPFYHFEMLFYPWLTLTGLGLGLGILEALVSEELQELWEDLFD